MMKTKKPLSAFLVIAMLITLLPTVAITAAAEAAGEADYVITGGPTSFKIGGSGDYGTLAGSRGLH